MTVDSDAAKVTASRLVRRFIFNAIQDGASEAQILYDQQRITTAYCLDGQWQRQDDMPVLIWPQILRRIRNMAFLTLGPQPPRQEGNSQLVLVDEQRGEERHYTLRLTIKHDETADDIRIVIPAPARHPYQRPEGYVFVCGEKL
jgi:type II secretory ATPase GspE/PulE/Tfp pilus assembly ATPase PilB-like protein